MTEDLPAPAVSASPAAGFAAALETPSGKDTAYENFPVGSVLIAAGLRPHVLAFYAFARAADDIADNPDLDAAEKQRRLLAMQAALKGATGLDAACPSAPGLRASLAATGVEARHALDLLSAFTQDATKLRYDSWDELIDYCLRSAAPVGRHMLDLHGEQRGTWPASDALCNALQVINHLQDCADDYRDMNRVYLPLAWLKRHGATVEHLGAPQASVALRRTLDDCLEATRSLLEAARLLPAQVADRRLRCECAVIYAVAERLAAKLWARDPLAGRVKLGKLEGLACLAIGLWRALAGSQRPGSARPPALPAPAARAGLGAAP